jgi:hypothetical protein
VFVLQAEHDAVRRGRRVDADDAHTESVFSH